jgi:hypothetical protein
MQFRTENHLKITSFFFPTLNKKQNNLSNKIRTIDEYINDLKNENN